MPREDGTIILTPYDSDKLVEIKTVQCRHCGRHWEYRKGSGAKRGFCMRCNGITCGSKQCEPCVPIEQQLENMERGRDRLFRPVFSAVPGTYRV